MFCASCGSNIGPARHFCPFCGAKLGLPAAVAARSGLSTPEGRYAGSLQGSDLVGVFGWLLFFCVILTVLGPLLLIMDRFRDPWFIILFAWLKVVFGVFVGINLWSRAQHALKLLRFYFVVAFVFALLGLIGSAAGYILQSVEKSDTFVFLGSMERFVVALVRLGVLAAWFSYFRTSKRVKATYGANL